MDMEVADTWASLLPDLLLDIFRRLEATDVVFRCAVACKPWRRAIVSGNATGLRPRPDCFVPSLLLGIFHINRVRNQALLRRVPGPFQSALPSTDDSGYDDEVAETFIPAACAGGTDRAWQYTELVSSRDGFILLMARRLKGLCLCNPMTGHCAFLHIADVESCTYILLTDYDLSPTCSRNDSWLGVQILAVAGTDKMDTDHDQMTYQLFSFTTGGGGGGAGAWGPVKRSEEMEKGLVVFMQGCGTAVCRDAVYWLAGRSRPTAVPCTVGLDVRTGRAWTTEMPTQWQLWHFHCHRMPQQTVLATSGDGRLSVITSLPGHQIHVWVLIGGDGGQGQWTLRQTIDFRNQLPQCPEDKIGARARTMAFLKVTAFCPRSGCMIGVLSGQEIRIDIESSSCVSAKSIGDDRGYRCYPYEMDWFTYISKMKHF